MFNNKESKKEQTEVAASDTTHVAKGTVLTGDVETGDNIRIEGKVVGNVICKSKVVLGGGTSIIEGNILSQNAEIYGEVKGKVEISELLTLRATAVIQGDIITNKLLVESGAVFNGFCKMGVTGKEIKLSESQNGKATKAVLQ